MASGGMGASTGTNGARAGILLPSRSYPELPLRRPTPVPSPSPTPPMIPATTTNGRDGNGTPINGNATPPSEVSHTSTPSASNPTLPLPTDSLSLPTDSLPLLPGSLPHPSVESLPPGPATAPTTPSISFAPLPPREPPSTKRRRAITMGVAGRNAILRTQRERSQGVFDETDDERRAREEDEWRRQREEEEYLRRKEERKEKKRREKEEKERRENDPGERPEDVALADIGRKMKKLWRAVHSKDSPTIEPESVPIPSPAPSPVPGPAEIGVPESQPPAPDNVATHVPTPGTGAKPKKREASRTREKEKEKEKESKRGKDKSVKGKDKEQPAAEQAPSEFGEVTAASSSGGSKLRRTPSRPRTPTSTPKPTLLTTTLNNLLRKKSLDLPRRGSLPSTSSGGGDRSSKLLSVDLDPRLTRSATHSPASSTTDLSVPPVPALPANVTLITPGPSPSEVLKMLSTEHPSTPAELAPSSSAEPPLASTATSAAHVRTRSRSSTLTRLASKSSLAAAAAAATPPLPTDSTATPPPIPVGVIPFPSTEPTPVPSTEPTPVPSEEPTPVASEETIATTEEKAEKREPIRDSGFAERASVEDHAQAFVQPVA